MDPVANPCAGFTTERAGKELDDSGARGFHLRKRPVADGMLVSTAAGSTSYARAMGATPIPAGTHNLLVVGSNVFLPTGWKSAQLDLHARVAIRSVDPTPPPRKRPVYGFVDGIELGEMTQLTARLSNIAAVELAFLPGQGPRRKIHRFQFPS